MNERRIRGKKKLKNKILLCSFPTINLEGLPTMDSPEPLMANDYFGLLILGRSPYTPSL